MGDIVYKKVSYEDIHSDFLKGYKRTNTTEEVYYLENGILKMKKDYFEEDWDAHRLEEIAKYLKWAGEQGGLLVAAYDKDQVVGFTNIESRVFNDTYIHMPFIHTHADYRGQGIGETMFQFIVSEAKQFQVKKLYISTHPNIHAQRFYQKLGCKLAEVIIKELYDKEPLDIQLEFVIDDILLPQNKTLQT